MKRIIGIFLFTILVVGYSCEKKNEKSSLVAVESEISKIDSPIPKAPIDTTFNASQMTQKQIFNVLVDAMELNDMGSYNKFIPHLNNIDTLVLFPSIAGEDEYYHSLLAMSCRLNRLEPMKDLILRGADIRIGSKTDFTSLDVLYSAIVGGNAEMVKILVDKKTDVNTLYTSTGVTPLVLTVINKKQFMAEILLKAGAKVDGAGKLDMDYILYPLHEAIRKNDVEMVKLLLQYKADTKLKDADGLDALALAESRNAKEIIQLLKK